jgi:hypothetical protein
MKKLLVLLAVSCSANMIGQEIKNILTTPNSPAASILGMQPSEVLKPKSFRALEAALYSNFTNDEGITSPDNFGLEFTPYWAKDHHLSLDEYLYSKKIVNQIARNSAFSLASTHKFLLQDSTATNAIAVGYRTSLFFGNKQDTEILAKQTAVLKLSQNIGASLGIPYASIDPATHTTKEDYLDALKDDLTKLIIKNMKLTAEEADVLSKKIIKEAGKLPFDKNDPDTFFASFLGVIDTTIGLNFEDFTAYLLKRQGFSLDFATAVFVNFPDGDFNFSEVPKYSFWLTPSYNFSKNLDFLKATASIRYEHYYIDYFKKYFPDSKVYDTNFDYGVTITGNFKKFSIDFEASGRSSSSLIESGTDSSGNTLYRKENSNDTQYIGTFSYRLTDQIAISYQIGSAFKPIFTTTDTLISLLSLNFGFGDPAKTTK